MRSLRRAVGAVVGAVLLSGGVIGATPAASEVPVTASSWSIQPMASPSTSADVFVEGVSCVTAKFCVAVGQQGTLPAATTLAEIWNGGGWSVVPTPNPLGAASSELLGVSCVTSSFCMAVGDSGSPGTFVTLTELWNGSAWSIVSSPTGPSAVSALVAVSCTSVQSCMAVGGSANTPLAEQWNGTSWSIQAVTIPAGSTNTQLNGVTCIGNSWCMAVGFVIQPSVAQPLVETWNGSGWTVGSAPPVSGTHLAELNGISCAGSQFCVGVGLSFDGTTETTLVETWNGSSWSITPSPNNTGHTALAAVDCTSRTSCTAIGQMGPPGSETPVTETWNGSSWTLVVPPAPAGVSPVILASVSCLANWACVAAGFSATSSIEQPYAISAPISRSGYRFVASDGGVFAYGAGAPFLGSTGGQHLNAPIVGTAPMPAGDGYYLVASDGGVFSYGSAKFYGSMGGKSLNKPIVGMAVTADGGGYWLVASDGGIFSFGDAQFYGSTGALTLNKPVVAMAATPDGLGYYLVASDGGIFNYGNAAFSGSMGGQPLNKPIVGMAVPVAGGYYLVASDGGIFSFPTGAAGAPFLGSTGALRLNKPIVGMTATSGGYYLSGSDGGIFSFPGGGMPPFFGSTGSITLNAPVVGVSG